MTRRGTVMSMRANNRGSLGRDVDLDSLLDSEEMAMEFAQEPNRQCNIFFVNSDPTDLQVIEEIAALTMPWMSLTSIMRFLILSTITQ
jgi:hypothetical protein